MQGAPEGGRAGKRRQPGPPRGSRRRARRRGSGTQGAAAAGIALATFAQVLHREFVVCQTGQGILVEASFFEKFKTTEKKVLLELEM